MTVLAGASLAEICSTYPSAGSVYHWSAEMGSKAHGPFWAFVTAWFNFLGKVIHMYQVGSRHCRTFIILDSEA